MTRTELIATLEAAEGPSRELDFWIHCLRWGNTDINWAKEQDAVHHDVPNYTFSIDAALSFTPEIAVAFTVNGNPRYGSGVAEVWLGNPGPMYGAEGATPAIALCIANLRALEAQEEEAQ